MALKNIKIQEVGNKPGGLNSKIQKTLMEVEIKESHSRKQLKHSEMKES